MKMKDYCLAMEEKYSKKIKEIDSILLSVDSQQRGIWLYEVLHSRIFEVKPELKYYIFKNWWTAIDAHHEKFPVKDIRKWIKSAKVELDLDNLTVGDDGFVKIYRGVNEYSRGWDGLSWTTDKRVALKFAWGATVRRKCHRPMILEAGVALDFILGVFNDRDESEILCDIIEQKCRYDVKELLDIEENLDNMTEVDEGYIDLKKRYDELLIEFDIPMKKVAIEESQEVF